MANRFPQNDYPTGGNVNLTRITSDEYGLGSTYRHGLYVWSATGGSITLTCGSFTNNGAYGVYQSTTVAKTLIGVVASGNPSGNIFPTSGVTIIRTCPLP